MPHRLGPLIFLAVATVLIAAIGLALFRPTRGGGHALLAVLGSLMQVGWPLGYYAFLESHAVRFAVISAVVACIGLALLFLGVRGKLRALRGYEPWRCACCGYDRRGLAADAKCPECGTVPAPTAPTLPSK